MSLGWLGWLGGGGEGGLDKSGDNWKMGNEVSEKASLEEESELVSSRCGDAVGVWWGGGGCERGRCGMS